MVKSDPFYEMNDKTNIVFNAIIQVINQMYENYTLLSFRTYG